MFIVLKSGTMLNMVWVKDYYQGKHDKTKLIYLMVNGTKITEEYDSEQEVQDKVQEITENINSGSTTPKFSIKVVDELPTKNISETTIYLLKTGDEEDNMYSEYIYVNNDWELLGTQKLDLSNFYNKDEIDAMFQWKEY